MMTTETRQAPAPQRGSGRILVASGAVGLCAGAVVAVLAGVMDGGSAAVAALVGAATVVVVMLAGAGSVDAVSRRIPEFAMAYALMAYSGQVVLLLLGSVLLRRSDLLDGAADRQWLGIAAIVAVLIWLPAQILLYTRQRIPAFDVALPAAPDADDRSVDQPRAGEH